MMKKSNKFTLIKVLNGVLAPHLLFHNQTKFDHFSKKFSDEKSWPSSWKTTYYKAYARLPEVLLPKPRLIKDISLRQALINRGSIRSFSQQPISQAVLSTFLYYSAGIYSIGGGGVHRFYPSGGARYPLETYVLPLNSVLQKGLYHYNLKNHSLERLLFLKKNINTSKFFGQEWIANAGCIIIITGIFERTTMKYGGRGYRHILIEAGHMGQNMYLLASALNIGCCAIGGFIDDKLNALLDVDGTEETVLYAFALGNVQKK